ncbi:EAL domain-containing protein [Dinoroseobacter sp. PD6]|uniref:EAL domain-containing protein n=1 Tax=Dinoroseobacter sp. PD6 TaxID=3028384 RepID=UPI00237C1830|nr:EAL domain-containing protein [Dinoroseobacter sp. PD6]MDD9716759.1 EAL domain-containing protein [Dinoroseobacter sp. PD6]
MPPKQPPKRPGPRNRNPQNTPLAEAVAQRDKSVIALVKQAVNHKNALLAFQPIMQAGRQNKVAYQEGLIRIHDDSGRLIPAKDFITVVEEMELGRQIDCLALERGLEALRLVPTLRLGINMSARSIGYPEWTETLERGLAKDPTIAERLILEITEQSAMTIPEIVTVFMRDLQRKGITFALDDFGAGHTSFAYLRDFFFDILKIDGKFIRNISLSADNQVLTQALISVAGHFDMFTVAESVENAADAAFLTAAGIDCMQGYLFAAPSTKPAWLDQPQRLRA